MVGLSAAVRLFSFPCLLLTALAAPLLLSGCGDDPAGPELSGDNLYQLVVSSEDLELIGEIVGEIALTVTLRTDSDLTFFAPTDEALQSLGAEMLGRLRAQNNREILEKLIRRHLVPGRIRTTDLRDGTTLEPLEGPPLDVRVDGEEITVGGALITEADAETSNGVLHQVDEVVRDHLTLSERLRVTPLISTFAGALETAGLASTLEEGGPYTLLIPINSSFASLGTAGYQALLSSQNRNVLTKVLRHHILPGRVRIDDLEGGDTPVPLEGTPLTVESEGGLTYLDGARVVVPEIETSDGLIYLLDAVVMSHLDLAEHLQITPHLATSYQIMKDSGVLDQLRGAGSFTVFAPTENAWAPLGIAFLPELRARPDLLLRTAQDFVAEGRLDRSDLLAGGTLAMLGGYELPIVLSEDVTGTKVYIGARGLVDFPPREASNGLLYTIAPFNYPPDLDLEERAVFTALYRFLNLVERAGLTSVLQDEGPYTVFAPTDDALNGVGIPDSQVANVVRYHIVPGLYEVGDLPSTIPDSLFFRLPTLEGQDIKAYPIGGGLGLNCTEQELIDPETGIPTGQIILVDCISVTSFNHRATNGVIHTLDEVLEPPTP